MVGGKRDVRDHDQDVGAQPDRSALNTLGFRCVAASRSPPGGSHDRAVFFISGVGCPTASHGMVVLASGGAKYTSPSTTVLPSAGCPGELASFILYGQFRCFGCSRNGRKLPLAPSSVPGLGQHHPQLGPPSPHGLSPPGRSTGVGSPDVSLQGYFVALHRHK